MGKIIDINAELECRKIMKLEDFWTKLVLFWSTGIAEKIDKEIMADLEKKEDE